jgi:hypothetical protein
VPLENRTLSVATDATEYARTLSKRLQLRAMTESETFTTAGRTMRDHKRCYGVFAALKRLHSISGHTTGVTAQAAVKTGGVSTQLSLSPGAAKQSHASIASIESDCTGSVADGNKL